MPIKADASKITTDTSIVDRNYARRDRADYRWWLADEEDLYTKVFAVVALMKENLNARMRKNYLNLMMYNDVDLGFGTSTMPNIFKGFNNINYNSATTLNVVQNCVDAATSIVAKNRPKPLFITDGTEDYNILLKADNLTKYVQGVIEDVNLYELAERVFTDGGIYGTGALKIIIDHEDKKIAAEWVFLGDIFIDDLDAAKEKPSQLHQRQLISRDVLLEQYPDFAEEISMCNNEMDISSRNMSDLIPVFESWHLPSGKKAKDGLHTITIETATLLSEEYNKDYFPIVFWRWFHMPHGFWGRGIPDTIGTIQRTINKLLRTIDQSQDLVGVPVIMAPKTAMIASEHLLNNEIGHLVEYLGDTAPQFLTPPSVNKEIYEYIWTLESKAYNITGLSQAMSQGEKFSELRSGAAIREASDVATGRFDMVSQRWAGFFIEIAKIIVDLSKDLYKNNPDLQINVKDKDVVTTIKWEDVDMEKDKFKIDIFPVSLLPSTPQGRLDSITEFIQAGWMPKEFAMSLLEIPDLKRFTNLETSTSDLVQKTIAKIKETGKYTPDMDAIPQMKLDLAWSIGCMEIVRAKGQNMSQDILDNIGVYLQSIHDLMQSQQPPPPPPGAPPMMQAPHAPVGGPPQVPQGPPQGK